MAAIETETTRHGLTPQMQRFIEEHRLMVLATGAADGAPKVSTVLYHFDGKDIVVSSKRFTAHSRNLRDQPKVGCVINEGRGQLILYGTAEVIDRDPERLELSKRIFSMFDPEVGAPDVEPAKLAAMRERLNAEQRTIIRISPHRGSMNP